MTLIENPKLTNLACGAAVLCISLAFAAGAARPIEVVAAQSGRAVSGRVVVDGGAAPPRFALPILGPGRTLTNLAVNSQPDGTFLVTLPLGLSVVGAATGLPAGFTIKSASYGATDLLRDSLTVASTDTAELVIALNAPRIGSISGRVTGLKSTEGVRVVLRNNTPGTSWEAPLAADGSFVLTKVYPGTYSLRVSYGGIVTAKQVILANEDLKGVDLEMSRDRILLGHVLVEDGAAPDVVLEARTGSGMVTKSTTNAGGANMGRTFRLRLTDGEYAVSVPNVPAGFLLKSVSYGTTDLLKEPLKLDGLGLWEIVVRLSPTGR